MEDWGALKPDCKVVQQCRAIGTGRPSTRTWRIRRDDATGRGREQEGGQSARRGGCHDGFIGDVNVDEEGIA